MPAAYYRGRFHIDHVIAKQHGGDDSTDNRAWACLHCNVHKGPNIAGRDSDSEQLIRLFHPRTDLWDHHFTWRGARLEGKSAIGRVTIQVLAMNDAQYIKVRESLITEGLFPPI